VIGWLFSPPKLRLFNGPSFLQALEIHTGKNPCNGWFTRVIQKPAVALGRAGEGVLGLRRGFIQAGAQNLLMTLWPVSDKWTVDLMKGFYDEAMRTGNAPDALADVQREYLVKLKKEKNLAFAARLAGPFVMNFPGKP